MSRLILIKTVARDYHALVVAAALRELGCDPHIFSQSSLPGAGDFSIGGDWDDPEISAGGRSFLASSVKSFWNRRTARDFNFPPYAHPADHAHIEGSFSAALTGMDEILGDAFNVNPPAAAKLTSNKINQLRHARASGLLAPPTLITSDLVAVQAFQERHGALCMKPLSVYYWKDVDTIRATMTRQVVAEQLDVRAVSLVPAIYQPYVAKAYEVRLAVMGRTFIATRIGHLAGSAGEVDWRTDNSYLDRLGSVDTPDAVKKSARALMDRLGLKYGAFDFIVTPTGEWVFLEVNQGGQFAWQEIHQPAMRIIEPFARFLAEGRDDFLWDPAQASDALSHAALQRQLEFLPNIETLGTEPQPLDRSSHFDETGLAA